MAWRVKILPSVRSKINALHASGTLSRAGWIGVHTALHVELPHRAHRFRANRYPSDPDLFLFPVQFRERRGWRRFKFYVRDTLRPGLLQVEDMEHQGAP